MNREFFVTQIRQKEFSFLNVIAALNLTNDELNERFNSKINDYNNHMSALKAQCQTHASKTESIKAIYQFHKQNEDNLVELYIMASRAVWQHKAFKSEFATLQVQLREQLKVSRKFNKWAETLLTEQALSGQASLISKQSNEAMTYEDSAKLDPKSAHDKARVQNGEGLPLPTRLVSERFDPKHRAWGTMFPSIAHALRPIYDGWVNGARAEDLTVEIEFNDKLRVLDEQFNSSQSENQGRDPDDPSWFNSMNFYCTKRQALEYMVTTVNGGLVRGVTTTYVDTNKNSNHLGENRYIFVMDMHGNIFINQDGEYREGKRIGHSSFTQGAEIACAGEIKIREGKVVYLNNGSGHYQPGGYSLYRIVSELEKRGVLDSNCEVQDLYSDDFVVKTEKRINSRLSVAQFTELYERNTQGLNITEMHFEEKTNPLALLHCLENINCYLNKRAGETNGFLSFFGGYSGRDYYQRRQHFSDLIDVMITKTPIEVKAFIEASLPTFQRGRRSEYAQLLQELHSLLVNDNVLSHEVVKETLNTNAQIYRSLSACEDAYRTCRTKSKDDALSDIAQSKASYGLTRKKVSSELRQQFIKEDEMDELESHNARYF